MLSRVTAKRHTDASSPSAIPLPYRSLDLPDFQNLRFDIYQTAKIFLAYHQTSHFTDKSKLWPARCFEVGWEKYYSDQYEETGWEKVPDPDIPLEDQKERSGLFDLANLALHPAACVLHYAPATFEGSKAMISAKGNVVLFRPEMNARRMQKTASRLLLPKVPVDLFVDAVTQTVLANREFIPPFRRENWAWETRNPMCMYVRPLLFGHGPELGVKPAKDHLFMVYTSPVQAYWPIRGIRVLITSHFHRAAPGGTGNVKVIGNYASGLLPSGLAKQGFDWVDGKPVKVSDKPFHDVLYLDAVHNKYVEEFAGANFVAIATDGTMVVPQSDSILAGNTSASLVQLAESEGWRVEKRQISVDEIMDERRVAEAFCTGNAAIITPISELYYKGRFRLFNPEKNIKTKRLWDLLVGIQFQMIEDSFGWVREIG
jgi:branched-chain amino acid aminotransferase